MPTTTANRIASLDLWKGFIMIVMALDHSRDYFHHNSFLFDPADPEKSNLILFFTRWITHYCAPAFSLLAGISAFLAGRRKSKKELASFLFKRGLWLIFIEFTIVMFGWSFNTGFYSFGLLVIWSLGISMIFLAFMIFLPLKLILVISLVIIFGHNLLDNVHFDGNLLWSILHERGWYEFNGMRVRVIYPIIPWIGVMSLGYVLGTYYDRTVEPRKRQNLFKWIGLSAIVLFLLVRGVNHFGNAHPWQSYPTVSGTLISFFDPLKYPPSLAYLLMTLGPTILFLGIAENVKGKLVDFFAVYGKVPFLFYILHIYLIHLFAIILAQVTGFGWRAMILDGFVSMQEQLKGYGVSLWAVYLIWLTVVLLLYPVCKKFSMYKLAHKEKWWLSYL